MSNTILFIDSNVTDYEALLAGSANGVEVHVLNDTEDGVLQMAAVLQGRSGLDSIQILSHGSSGALYLGSSVLNGDSLSRYAEALSQIGSSLSEKGDILLYGCNVAEGGAGSHFIDSLAQYTGADVAASDGLTGSADLGGDWDLEKHVGNIETGLALSDTARASYAHTLVLANFGFDSATVIDQGSSVEETVNGVKITASTDSTGLGLSGNELFDTSNQGTYLQLQFSQPVDVSSFLVGFWTNSGAISSFTIEGYVGGGATPTYTYSAAPGYSELWTGSNGILPPYTVNLSGGNDWGKVDSIKVTVNPVGTVHVGFVADNIAFTANTAPVVTPPAVIDYIDTIFDDTFATATGTLAASDVEGDALTYGIEGGTDNGDGTISMIGSYGTLIVTKATGAYSFAADTVAIQSLAVNASAGFTVTASDASLSGSETLTINITQDGNTESSGKDRLTGTSGDDKFYGLAGNDHIYGMAGADTIKGGSGRDILRGDSGNDVLNGGNGNDVLWGGIGNNTLAGGAGNDKLIVGKGHNLLTGDGGRDIFRFVSASKSMITDFVVADDTIQLENKAFSQLTATGVLAASQFATGKAADADDYIIYNNSAGKLYYDADGSGAGAATLIAVLGVNLALSNADFIIT